MNHINVYVTDFGEVRISQREANILALEQDIKRELSDSPFLEQPHVRRVLAKAATIKDACYRFADHENLKKFQDFK
jgi:hypothetical protein